MYTAPKDESIATLKNTSQKIRSTTNEAMGDVADEAKQGLRAVAGNASRKVLAFIHSAEDEIVHARDTVTTQIRSKPVQSSAIALGVGLLLGALMRRR